jgi:WD40 repeat protein
MNRYICMLLILLVRVTTFPFAAATSMAEEIVETQQNPPRGEIIAGPVIGGTYFFDGQRLLIARENIAYLFNTATGEEICRYQGHTEDIRAVAMSPDGRWVLTAGGRKADMGSFSTDNSARLWDLSTGKEIRRFVGHKDFLHTIKFSSDGMRIITVAHDSSAMIWDLETERASFSLSGVNPQPRPGSGTVTFSPDGSQILGLIAGGHRIKLWNAATGKELLSIERDTRFFQSAEFSPDGKIVLTASSSGIARTWDASTGRQIQEFSGHISHVNHAIFTNDGHRVITASSDGTVRLWDSKSGKEIRKFTNSGSVAQILVNATGKRIISQWDGGDLSGQGFSLWDAESGQEFIQIGDGGRRKIVGFGPDGKTIPIVGGKTIPTKGNDIFISLWNAETGSEISRKK